MGFIYMLTSPSKKSYIGQTTKPIEERFKEHQRPSSQCVAISHAIQYHSWEKMKKEWHEVPDEDLNFYEEMLVALLGTLSPGGYNLKEGGGSGGKMCEEVKQKMSESTKGEKNPMYGKTHTDDVKQKISDGHKGDKNHFYGKTLSDGHKQKLSDANSGENHPIFGKNLKDGHKQKISESLLGEGNPRSKRVYQYDTNGEFIQSFASSGEEARDMNKEYSSSIRDCANGKRKSAHGFKWSFTEL
ncbi:GIY-YIG catalytic domain-containing endonuclease [Acanthocystis turfacea Chlorella virus Br0604L]|nr:GIY-YIG catalytic domain-containing endonuclease [Acanthocystis turfacea Chlorella virus Br0604L]